MPKAEPTREPGVFKVVGTYTTRYRAVVDVGKDEATGKRRQKTKTFETLAEAIDWRLATRHKLRERTYVEPSAELLADFLSRWLDTLSRPGPASRLRYQQAITRQIAPHLGSIALGELTTAQIDGWTATLAREGLAPATIRSAYVLLNQALGAAVRWKLIAANPAASAAAPRVPKRETATWDAEQIRRFLAFTAADALAPLWQLALLLGLRRGELLTLRWEDVDLEQATLTIRRTLTRNAAGHWVAGDAPKTAASRRTIPLPAGIVAGLRAHQERQATRQALVGDAWQDEGLVFERGDGKRIDHSALWHHFGLLSDLAGLPRIRPHDMRHSATSYMLTVLQIPLLVVGRILGHTAVSITGDVYGHLHMPELRAVAQQLDGLLPNPGDQPG